MQNRTSERYLCCISTNKCMCKVKEIKTHQMLVVDDHEPKCKTKRMMKKKTEEETDNFLCTLLMH